MDSDFKSGESRHRTLLSLLTERSANDDVLAVVGAGPLEDFVSDDEDRLLWIEKQAAKSGRFRTALRNVWARGYVTAETFDRLQKAAGVPLK